MTVSFTICFSIIIPSTAATTFGGPDEIPMEPPSPGENSNSTFPDEIPMEPPSPGENSDTRVTGFSPQIFSQILYDDDGGHARLWNPDSNANTFLINDTRVSGSSSTIIVNTDQGTPSLVICVTSGITDGFFEISCTKPPVEGAQLRYVVLNAEPLPPPSPSISKYLDTRYGGNLSKDVKLGPLPSFSQNDESDIPILSQR